MKKYIYQILSGTTGTTEYNLPIFLESSVDEMGIMVGFDGEIEQVEQFCNFTYGGNGNTITIYNTLNTNKIKTLIDSVFTVSWGDLAPDSVISMTTVYNENLTSSTHTYAVSGRTYDIEITVDSPWKTEKLKRSIYIPLSGSTYPTNFGVLTFTVPYSNPPVSQTQQYLEDYRSITGTTKPVSGTTISFLAVGKSRIDEKKLYGDSDVYDGLTFATDISGMPYTGYTLNDSDLYYMDYEDGYTYITGNTSSYEIEEVYNGMITRNEHLIGFLDEPQIYSDIFVERGKQGVMEKNLRLGEIDSTGELDIYGSGYFKVRKQ